MKRLKAEVSPGRRGLSRAASTRWLPTAQLIEENTLRALAIVLAAPVVGMGIGSFFALSAIGSDVLNVPEWSWISFSTSIFLATAALLYSKAARKLSKALLIYPAVLSSIGAFGFLDGIVGGPASGCMVEVMDTLTGIAGAGLIGVFPLLMSIILLLEAWPEIAPKQLSQKNANK